MTNGNRTPWRYAFASSPKQSDFASGCGLATQAAIQTRPNPSTATKRFGGNGRVQRVAAGVAAFAPRGSTA